jgi:hypothetical protein
MSAGQLIEDVRLAVNGVSPVYLEQSPGRHGSHTGGRAQLKSDDIVEGRVKASENSISAASKH